jgi:hypothetical protein
MSDKVRELIESILHVSQQGHSSLELLMSKDRESYFYEPLRPEYNKLDQIPFEDKDHLVTYLQSFWKDNEALLPFIPQIVDLAFQLKSQDENDQGDLSPYIYTLF